jgi:hypothetical protein
MYLAEAIKSVFAQNYGNFEYLLVNNQTTDGSRELAVRYASGPGHPPGQNPAFVEQRENYNGAFGRVAANVQICEDGPSRRDTICPDCLRPMVAVNEQSPRIGLLSSYYCTATSPWAAASRNVTQLSGREVCRLMLLTKKFVVGLPLPPSQCIGYVHADRFFA